MGAGPGLSFTPITLFGDAGLWTDMPAAATELLGSSAYRVRIHTEGYTQIRLHVHVVGAGAAGAVLQGQYTTDLTGATGWATLTTNTASLAAAGGIVTTWETLPAGARNADIMVRVAGSGGDGAADPALANLRIDLR